MSRPWQGPVTAALALALAGPCAQLAAAFTFPAQRRGNVEAVLEVRVADAGPAPGLGAATYVLRVHGPASLDVPRPDLADAGRAWKVNGTTSSWQGDGSRAAVTWTVYLQQVQPGRKPLPDVRLRFREGNGPWQDVVWTDLLGQPRDVMGPAPPPASSSAVWVWAAVLGAVTAAVLLLGVLRRRRRTAPAVPAAPEVRALRELERLERTSLPPALPPEVFHTRLSEVVRLYLADCFGLKALEQTTPEFLTAARQLPQLAEQEATLRALCERWDLAKFARIELSAEECRRSARLARSLVEQTRSPRRRDGS
jgi:hypothetical protein